MEGINNTFYFHPKRVNDNKNDIIEMLEQLPEQFAECWSFLKLSETKDGEQWTGMVLGLAINKMEYCAPKSMWDMMPGAMPYVVLKLDKGNTYDKEKS